MKSESEGEGLLRQFIGNLASPDPQVRGEAAILLSAIAAAPARTEEDRRLTAILIAEAVEPLTRALLDPDPRTRDAAREALEALRLEAGSTPPAPEGQASAGASPSEEEGRGGGRPDRVRVYYRGELREEVDTRLLEPGEDMIPHAFYYLPWRGESTIHYDFKDGFLRVEGKLVGVELPGADLLRLESRDDVVWVQTNAEHFAELPSFPNLMAVSARDRIADDDLTYVEDLTNLRVLSIGEVGSLLRTGESDAQITDAGMVHLRNLAKLRELSLQGTRVTDAGLAHLMSLRALRDLGLGGTLITDAGLAGLEILVNLRSLSLPDTRITDAGLACLARLQGLQRLDLSGTAIRGNGLAHLRALPSLERLGLNLTLVDDAGLEHLASYPRLRSLGLSGEKGLFARDEGRPWAPAFTGRGLGHLARLSTLEVLDLGCTPITGEGMVSLGRMANLRELNLTGTPITNSGMAHLGGLTQLRELLLGGTKIGDAGVAHLKGLTNLERLEIWGTNVTDAVIPHLMGLKHLKVLGLGSTRVSGAAVAPLRAALPDCEISHKEREAPDVEQESGCFIATAAFGSPEALEVQALRDFRDQVLARHAGGRSLISLYQFFSPPLAGLVSRSPAMKSAVRTMLRFVVVLLERRATAT